jgi:hypothetical protein
MVAKRGKLESYNRLLDLALVQDHIQLYHLVDEWLIGPWSSMTNNTVSRIVFKMSFILRDFRLASKDQVNLRPILLLPA